ncbi:unnamed protein product [Camellia sinensis]
MNRKKKRKKKKKKKNKTKQKEGKNGDLNEEELVWLVVDGGDQINPMSESVLFFKNNSVKSLCQSCPILALSL